MKNLKRIGIVVAILIPVLFIAFLMIIPPLTLIPQEEFIAPTHAVQSDLSGIADPAERLIAERGSYLVHTAGCTDCHTPQSAEGPDLEQYLSGGILLGNNDAGGIVAANLTSDEETGLGALTDAQVVRALRSGIYHTGRQINYRAMPWGGFSNFSEEDLRAIVAYLRIVKPVRKKIPTPPVSLPAEVPGGADMFFPGDFGEKQ